MVVAACGSYETTGDALPAPRTTITWNPCDELPPSATASAGLGTPRPVIPKSDGSPVSKTCTYSGPGQLNDAMISAFPDSFGDLRSNTDAVEVIDEITIADRAALVSLYRDASCLTSVDIPDGLLEFSIPYGRPGDAFRTADSACTAVRKLAEALSPHFPARL